MSEMGYYLVTLEGQPSARARANHSAPQRRAGAVSWVMTARHEDIVVPAASMAAGAGRSGTAARGSADGVEAAAREADVAGDAREAAVATPVAALPSVS